MYAKETKSREPIVVHLPSVMDATAVAALRPALETLAANGNGQVVMDLGAVETLDAAGLGAIVFLHKRLLARGRSLVLTKVAGEPAELLRALRVHRVIAIRESVTPGCAA